MLLVSNGLTWKCRLGDRPPAKMFVIAGIGTVTLTILILSVAMAQLANAEEKRIVISFISVPQFVFMVCLPDTFDYTEAIAHE